MKYIFPSRRKIPTSLHGVTFKNIVVLTPIKFQILLKKNTSNVLITTSRELWLFYFQVILIVYHL